MTLHESLDPAACAPSPASFHDLMASIGYLLFQWSMVEQSLDAEIATLRHAAGDVVTQQLRARTINERLGEWRALLGRGRRRNTDQASAVEQMSERIQDLLRLRNLVANGLTDVVMDGAEPIIRCTLGPSRHGAPDEVRLVLRDLLAGIELMEATRSEIALLRTPTTH